MSGRQVDSRVAGPDPNRHWQVWVETENRYVNHLDNTSPSVVDAIP